MRWNKLVGLLLGLLCLQLSGCTSALSIKTTQPPTVTVAHKQWKVLVVNRYDASLSPYKKDRKIELYQEGAAQAVASAMSAIFNDDTFVLINLDQAILLPSSPTDTLLSQAEVRDLYTSYRPHLILTLDEFDARLSKEEYSYEDEKGFHTKTANFDLIVSSNWSLYDSTGQVIDQATTHQKELYYSRPIIGGSFKVGPDMAEAGPNIARLAVETGYNYWDRFYPQPMLLEREVHLSNTLNQTVLMLTTGQFQKAIDTLLPIAHDSTAKQHRKATYNLSVAYEAIGDYERAVYWARQAEKKGDKLAANLLAHWENAGLLQ